jgi:protein SCO1/2
MRERAAIFVAALSALAILGAATDGFRVYTAEAARRLDVLRSPRPVPDLLLEDQSGRRLRFSELRGRRVCVAFVYTRCPGVCTRIAHELGGVASALRARGTQAGAALLSVSFDAEHDTPQRLRGFASLHAADGELWRFARALDARGLARWLDVFGIVVIPDGAGGFLHNAAFHLVDESGALVRIVDLGALDEVERFLAGAELTS